jgi:hypothetical protein
LIDAGVAPTEVLPRGKFFPGLKAQGFESFVLCPKEYALSSYNRTVCADANLLPYEDFRSGAAAAANLLARRSTPSLVMLYTDLLDKTNHHYTKDSPEHREVLGAITSVLRDSLFVPSTAAGRDCSVLVTSDHGHMTIDPQKTVYLNELIPDLDDYLIRGADGNVIPCSGGFRSLFLHCCPDKRNELIGRLGTALNFKALVLPLESLFTLGVFDFRRCSEQFWDHAGNIVVLPFAGESVSYRAPGFIVKRVSVPGGASEEEMSTPMFESNLHSLVSRP